MSQVIIGFVQPAPLIKSSVPEQNGSYFADSIFECIFFNKDIYASMNWVITGPDNGLSPVRRQAITWTNAGLLLIGILGTYFGEIWNGIL